LTDATDRARYLSAVEARFVTLRGRGYALSARDVERVEKWRTSGVPLHVALRVLEDGVREYRRTWRRGEGGPRSLAYFGEQIGEVMRQRGARLVTPAVEDDAPEAVPEDRWERLLGAVEAAGKRQRDERAREVLRRAWRRLRAGRDAEEDVWALTAEVDSAIVAELVELLPRAQLEGLSEAAREAVERAGGARMSEQARGESHRFELDLRVRDALAVPELLEVLLDEPAM